jgi:hypothetical protein
MSLETGARDGETPDVVPRLMPNVLGSSGELFVRQKGTQ